MKTELVAKLMRNHDDLFDALKDLSEEQITKIPVVGEWTIKDVIGHVSYWEQVIHAHIRESFSEGRPRPMSNDETEDIINPREAAKRKKWSWARVRAEFENTRRALIERVESLSESDLSFQVPNPWWNQTHFYSIAQMIEEDALSHSREHIEQIVKCKLEVGG